MSDKDTPASANTGPLLGLGSSDGLGPLPERTLAEIHNPATGERELSETGTAYYGSNWREVRKLYTADDMRAFRDEAVAAERERCALLANTWAGYFKDFQSADEFARLVRLGPNVEANRLAPHKE